MSESESSPQSKTNSASVSEKAEYSRQWRARNPGKAAEYSRQWRERHPERRRLSNAVHYQRRREQAIAYSRQWRERNPERAAAQKRSYNARNPDKVAAWAATYYRKYRERAIAYQRTWREQNPQRVDENNRIRSARRLPLNFDSDGNEDPAAGLAAYTAQQQQQAAADVVAELLELLEDEELAVLELLADLDYDAAKLPAEVLPAWERIQAKARRP